MTPEIERAIGEIQAAFVGHQVDVRAEPQGGAYVIVHSLSLGHQYTPATSWVGFLITFQYPYADVYPHFIDSNVRRGDGRALGPGFSGPTTWPGQPGQQVLQISRRSKRWHPATDTVALKLVKILEWIRSQ